MLKESETTLGVQVAGRLPLLLAGWGSCTQKSSWSSSPLLKLSRSHCHRGLVGACCQWGPCWGDSGRWCRCWCHLPGASWDKRMQREPGSSTEGLPLHRKGEATVQPGSAKYTQINRFLKQLLLYFSESLVSFSFSPLFCILLIYKFIFASLGNLLRIQKSLLTLVCD